MDRNEGAEGWSSQALEASIRRSVGYGAAVWCIVMMACVIASSGDAAAKAAQIGAYALGVVVYGGLARDRVTLPVAMMVGVPLSLLGWWPVRDPDSTAVFASAWLQNLMVGATAFLLPRGVRAIVPLGIGVASSAIVLGRQPSWDSAIPFSFTVTAVAMTVVVTRAATLLSRFGSQVDQASAQAAAAETRAAVSRSAIRSATESARTLHDTVINTLGVLASGGTALADTDRVRQRCTLDLRAVEAVADNERGSHRGTFVEALHVVGIEVQREGSTDDEIAAWCEGLPDRVVGALNGAVREAVGNAARHSGAETVLVAVRTTADELEVHVRDRGQGFDLELVSQRGLAESIGRRTAEVGIGTVVVSAPGSGTSVRLRLRRSELAESSGLSGPVGPTGLSGPEVDIGPRVAQLAERVCWAWAFGATAVGVLLQAGSHYGQSLGAWANLLVMALAVGAAFRRRRGRMPLALELLLVASTPLIFWLSLSGIGDAPGAIVQWQALSMTAPSIVLVLHSRRPGMLLVTLVLTGVVALATAVQIADSGASYAGCVPVGFLAGVGLLLVMESFRRTLGEIGARAEREQRQLRGFLDELAARRAAAEARLRWRMAGLDLVADLLRDIAGGRADPADSEIRAASGREERHLRQILMLSPELVHIGVWGAHLLSWARGRQVELVLRLGDHDMGGTQEVRLLRRAFDPVLASVPIRASMTVSVFPHPHGRVVTLVTDARITGPDSRSLPSSWMVSTEQLGDQTLIEVHVPDAGR
jgi:signal transduction histidine kinase